MIQTSLKAGHHRPASEKCHLNGISLASRLWSNIELCSGSFEFFRGSRPVLLRKPHFCDLSGMGGGSGSPVPPSESAHD